MPFYLYQMAYAHGATKALVEHPQNREEAAKSRIESLGGKLTAYFFAFGEYDVIAIAEFPDNITAGAVSLADGFVRRFRQVPHDAASHHGRQRQDHEEGAEGGLFAAASRRRYWRVLPSARRSSRRAGAVFAPSRNAFGIFDLPSRGRLASAPRRSLRESEMRP